MGTSSTVRRVVRDATLGLAGLLAGAGLFIAGNAVIGSADELDPSGPVALDLVPAPDGPGAASPRAAIETFLDAEATNDVETSFNLLSAADRATYPTVNAWAARRASALGPVLGWAWTDGASATTDIDVEPGLSVTTGWTPSARTITWTTVDEDGWRVSLSESDATSTVAAPEGAAAAAAEWLNDRDRCETNDLEQRPTSALFEQLCHVGGVTRGGESVPVTGALAADLSNTYGADVRLWARTVSVEGGVDLVVAAVGEQWVVIDAVEAS